MKASGSHIRATPGEGELYTTPIQVCGDVPACRAPFFHDTGMPRTSQKSSTRANDVARRTREPREVTVGSSAHNCNRPGTQAEPGGQVDSAINTWAQRAGRAAT